MLETSNDASLFEGFSVEEREVETIQSEEKSGFGLGIETSSDLAKEIEANLKGETPEVEDEEDETPEIPEEQEKSKEEEEVPEEKLNDEDEDETPSYSFKAIGEYLQSEGVIDIEGLDELEDSPEVLSYIVEKSVSKEISKYKESLPPLVAQLAEYLENGGDEEKFLETLTKPIDYKNIDLDVESNQELVVREYLRSQEVDVADIDGLIESYKDSLVLEKQANIAAKQLSKVDGKRTEALVKQQEEEAKEAQRQVDEYIEKVKNTVTNSKELAGLKVEDRERQEFTDYLLKRNPKTGLTKYQEDVNKDYVKNSVELAYLKFKNYDFSKVEKKAETEAAKKLKSKLFGKNESAPKGKTKEVVDKIDFSAFRSVFGK